MPVISIIASWVHLLCAMLFIGTMFVGTFVLLPVLKEHLEHEPRQRFIVHFVPRVRRIMVFVLSLLVLSGLAQTVSLYYTWQATGGGRWLSIFALHILFAAVPLTVFALAPKVLGRKSKAGLCCDPDAEDPPIFMGVMSSTGAALHYTAISGGWLAVLFAVILAHMR